MRIAVIILLGFTLTGCGWFDKVSAKFTGNASKVCSDGVVYLQFTSGSSVAYNTDGTIKLCD